jgi:lysophospholipase L1-like esterase
MPAPAEPSAVLTDGSPAQPAQTSRLRPSKRVGRRSFLLSGLVGLSLALGALPSCVLQEPRTVRGLKLWLAADQIEGLPEGMRIASWPDLSGYGYHAQQADPGRQPMYHPRMLNGRPALRFDGGSGLMTPPIALGGATGLTAYLVVSASGGGNILESSTNTSVTNGAFDLFRQPAGTVEVGARIAGTSLNFVSDDRLGPWPNIVTGWIDTANVHTSIMRSYINGRFAGSWPNTGIDLRGSFDDFPWYVGMRGDESSFLLGDIAEVLLYAAPHSAAERRTVEEYLARKWQAPLTMLDGIIVFDGDSNVRGVTSNNRGTLPNPYPNQCIALLTGRYDWYNYGTDGDTLRNLILDAQQQIDSHIGGRGLRKVVVIWAGTNDMQPRGDNVSAERAYQRLRAYCADRRAARWKVVVATALPAADALVGAGYEERRLAFNDLVRSEWQSFADGLADVGGDRRIGLDGAFDDPDYFTEDRGHLNNGGYAVVAGHVADALRRLGVV